MSNVGPIAAAPENPPKRWVAVVLSLVLVGSGHAYVGQWRRAAIAFAGSYAMGLIGAVAFVAHPSAITVVIASAGVLLLALLRYALVVDLLVMPAAALRRTRWTTVIPAAVAFVGLATAPALLMRRFVLEAFKIPAGSMQPSLLVGDHVFVAKSAFLGRPPARGEMAVFASPEHPDQDLVKRVIAREGDTLELRDGHPWINGREVPRCFVGAATLPSRGDGDAPSEGDVYLERLDGHAYLTFYDRTVVPPKTRGPFHVAPGEYWVLGDDRSNSYDSPQWHEGRGAGVPRASFRGPPVVVWLSVPPSGEMDWSRVGLDLTGPPQLPESMRAALALNLARCLREPHDATSPPAPSP